MVMLWAWGLLASFQVLLDTVTKLGFLLISNGHILSFMVEMPDGIKSYVHLHSSSFFITAPRHQFRKKKGSLAIYAPNTTRMCRCMWAQRMRMCDTHTHRTVLNASVYSWESYKFCKKIQLDPILIDKRRKQTCSRKNGQRIWFETSTAYFFLGQIRFLHIFLDLRSSSFVVWIIFQRRINYYMNGSDHLCGHKTSSHKDMRTSSVALNSKKYCTLLENLV